MNNEISEIIKSSPKVLEQVYVDLAQPSVRAVGVALGTVFEFSTSMLLPLKLLNEKFKLNFTKRLNEYKDKLNSIPEEDRCEVHPQIGTPIIEKLSYTTTDEIADLFTSLLASASNKGKVNMAHPSFVGIIERLSTDEARIIQYLKGKEEIEYCEFRGNLKDNKGFIPILSRATLLRRDVKLDYPTNLEAYLANFVSLGILIDMDTVHKVDTSVTDQICQYYCLNDLRTELVPKTFTSIVVKRSYFSVTKLGQMFINACVE